MRIAAVFRVAAFVLSTAATIVLGLAPAVADKRVALVIGNGEYKKASELLNPIKDAKAIAGMLRSAGFDAVELHENLGIRELRRAIGEFSDIARDADTAIVYYSGHGMEVNGVNYLIPVDAVLERDIDVPYEAFSLDNLLQVLEPVKRLRLVMLDACRNNPFVRSMKRTIGTRAAIGRGLAAVEPTSVNTLIGFAAKAGSYALDGEGANSPYAIALLNNLATPGLDLRIAFGRVRDEVMKATKSAQEPFIYGSLGGANVSVVDALAAPIPSTAPSLDSAERAWNAIKDTTSIAMLEEFLGEYGGTFFGRFARARVQELRKKEEQQNYIAARRNEYALQVYVEDCKACEYKPAALTELKQFERRHSAELEKQTFDAARGNIYALELYVQSCDVCEDKTAALSELKTLQQKQLAAQETEAFLAARGNISGLELYAKDCKVCENKTAALIELKELRQKQLSNAPQEAEGLKARLVARQTELDRQREQEMARQRAVAQERQRQVELERQRQVELERQRQAEQKKAKESQR